MNTKRGIIKAFKQFQRDLKQDKDFISFKHNSHRISYEDRKTIDKYEGEKGFSDGIIKPFKVIVNYQLPEINTKENRRLNNELL